MGGVRRVRGVRGLSESGAREVRNVRFIENLYKICKKIDGNDVIRVGDGGKGKGKKRAHLQKGFRHCTANLLILFSYCVKGTICSHLTEWSPLRIWI